MDWQQVGTAAVAICGVVGAYINFRKTTKKAIDGTLHQHNVELRALADTRQEEIESLTAKLKEAESERDGLAALYERALETIRFHTDEALRLRGEADTLRHDNTSLRQRIAGLNSNQQGGST